MKAWRFFLLLEPVARHISTGTMRKNGWKMDTLRDWLHPFVPGALSKIENAASACDPNASEMHSYRVVPSRSISHLFPWSSLAGQLATLRRLRHGRPQRIHLPFAKVEGMVGSYARSKKQRQRTRKENGLLFICRDNERQSVLKVSLCYGNLAREIRVLKLLAGTGIAPAVQASDPHMQWLQMEHVAAIAPNREDQAKLYLEDIAPVQFGHFGVKLMTAGLAIRQLGIERSSFLKAADLLRIENPPTLLECRLAASIIHEYGICSEVLIRKLDGTAVLLDWETAKLGPVAFDIMQAGIHWPKKALDLMNRWACPPGASDTRKQLLFALVCREARMMASRKIKPKKTIHYENDHRQLLEFLTTG